MSGRNNSKPRFKRYSNNTNTNNTNASIKREAQAVNCKAIYDRIIALAGIMNKILRDVNRMTPPQPEAWCKQLNVALDKYNKEYQQLLRQLIESVVIYMTRI
jgi:hypothetical protein